MNYIIRKEKQGELPLIKDLIKTSFENVSISSHDEHLLVERLHFSDTFIPELSLVAEDSSKNLAGYILLTQIKIKSDDQEYTSLSLAPLAVHPKYQSMGIGSHLIIEAHKIAKDLGYTSIMVLGHKDYYPRFGYRKAAEFNICFPFDVPQEYCMAIELQPNALKDIEGTVCYPDCFFE
ncbi:MAG: GNAT family N-acetyltransferase [Prevotella sp.]|jgi:predicted N-acetyltransferase YhbS